MALENQTAVQEFLLVAFQNIDKLKFLLFFSVFTVYLLALFGNILIIILVSTDPKLHSPMYFFLCHLSTSEILFITSIVPNMLYVILSKVGTISFGSCVTQYYLFSSTTSVECLLLAVMSYDRYLAICVPLHYSAIMNKRLCLYLVALCWVTGFGLSLIALAFMSHMDFCGSGIIDHFFCDLAPILNLSCSDTSFLEMEDFVLCFVFLIFPFVIIIVTYIRIILTILRIKSTTGKNKAFSTCSSHLTVVCTYYGTLIVIYMMPSTEYSSIGNKTSAILYTVVTPMLNPIIYSLRNNDIRISLRNISKRLQL
eukprot:XP_004913277.2 PREDICTED: olfactory receptor 10A7-like [Xenopus tropicalis]